MDCCAGFLESRVFQVGFRAEHGCHGSVFCIPLLCDFDQLIQNMLGRLLSGSDHGVRELGLSSPSERHIKPFNKIIDLLNMVEGITIHEPERKDECCGFGGMFSIEEPAVSTRMGEDKIKRHMATGAEYVTGPDSSCLMHMAGIAKKEKMPIKFIHVVQILAAGL